jgi:hypothetical protein
MVTVWPGSSLAFHEVGRSVYKSLEMLLILFNLKTIPVVLLSLVMTQVFPIKYQAIALFFLLFALDILIRVWSWSRASHDNKTP